jgi:multidrug efflux system membrane fusion protein
MNFDPMETAEGLNVTERPDRTRKSLWWLWLLIVLALLGTALYFIYTSTAGAVHAKKGGAKGGLPVVASAATRGDLPIYLGGLGSVTPFYTVTIKTRVDGQIDKIDFAEGQLVHQGDPLLEIDPRPYQVQLTQAQGQLAKDQAQFNNAKSNVDRDKLAGNAISQQQLATDQATMDEFAGAMDIDKGQIASANLNLAYCHVTAPITGRIGLRLVDQGNIVHASDTNGLAIITQRQPIAVVFTLAEDQIAPVQRRMTEAGTIEVNAYDRDPTITAKLATGKLVAIDNQIDPNSGTVKLKAAFDNKDNILFPNQFVNVKLLVDTVKGTVLVPAAAIQRSPQSTFVYVVKPNAARTAASASAAASRSSSTRPAELTSTVQMRNVTVGPTETVGPQDIDLTAVTSGLQPGDIVVTDGVDKLQDGSKVIVHRGDLPSIPTTTSAATTKPHRKSK